MNTVWTLIFFLLLFYNQFSFAQSREDIRQVTAVYGEIATMLNKGKFEDLARFIHPETGLVEVIDPVGVPYPIHHPNIGMAKLQGLFISAPAKNPEESSPPEFDCNIGMWTREGTFISEVKGYPLLISILPEASEVTYIDRKMRDLIEELSENISVLVLTTDESVLGFFKKEGVWWLGLVDNSFNCVE